MINEWSMPGEANPNYRLKSDMPERLYSNYIVAIFPAVKIWIVIPTSLGNYSVV